MILSLEFKKMRRTGYLPVFFGGALLTSAVPAVNMAVRADTFRSLSGSPFSILMDANWQMMAQLTILLLVCGGSLMYNTEYADRGDLKMNTLPVRQVSLFLGKTGLTLICTGLVLIFQTVSMLLCSLYWWPEISPDLAELLTGMGYELFLLLPTLTLTLVIASACQNMWISLGAGVILTFFGSMIPADHAFLALLPFAAPYQMLPGTDPKDLPLYLALCAGEILFFSLAEMIYLHYRRTLS